jgi:hypothetical protein
MSRSLGGGVVLAIIGAILAFAVQDSISGVDLTMIGYIILAGGVLLALIGIGLGFKSDKVTSSVRSVGPEGDRLTEREDKIS